MEGEEFTAEWVKFYRMPWLLIHCFQEMWSQMESAVVVELSWRASSARSTEIELYVSARYGYWLLGMIRKGVWFCDIDRD